MHDSFDNVLIAGAGGGFDIFAGLPLYKRYLNENGHPAIANYSFTNLTNAKTNLMNIHASGYNWYAGEVTACPQRKEKNYFPEGYLVEYLYKNNYISNGKTAGIYCFPKVGVTPLRDCYEAIVKELNLDTIILIDGGVDSIMGGFEEGCGTILEDFVSLAAVADLDVKNKLLITVGFGTEIEDNVSHYHALKNMAELSDALIDVFYLKKDDEGFKLMKDAYNYVTSKPNHAVSHIAPKIIAAVEGKFGDLGGGEFVTPLMPIYWFYDLNKVVARNKIIDKQFKTTKTFTDVNVLYRQKTYDRKLEPKMSLDF